MFQLTVVFQQKIFEKKKKRKKNFQQKIFEKKDFVVNFIIFLTISRYYCESQQEFVLKMIEYLTSKNSFIMSSLTYKVSHLTKHPN